MLERWQCARCFWAILIAISLICPLVGCQPSEPADASSTATDIPPSPTTAPPTSTQVPASATPAPTATAAATPTDAPPAPTTAPPPSATQQVPLDASDSDDANVEAGTSTATERHYKEQVVKFTTKDGVEIVATLYDAGGDPAVILGHMSSLNMNNRGSWAPFARHLAESGFTALALDFRGFGASIAQVSYSKQPLDLLAAMGYLRDRGHERFICMGASMGGTACFDSALEGVEWDGLALIAAPITATQEEVAHLTMPKLLVGERGNTADLLATQKLYMALPEPKSMQKYPEKAHGIEIFDTPSGDDFRALLTEFVEGIQGDSSGSEAPGPSPASSVEKTRDVAYAGDGHAQQVLDVYTPAGQEGPFPSLLLMHGGGENKASLARLGTDYAKKGYAVVSIDYRDSRSAKYPVPVQDAFCALAWMHANAKAYGFDPSRVVALGHSLGGTLAAMLATVDDPGRYLADCPHDLPGDGSLQGAITFTGIFDYASAARDRDLRAYASGYLGAEQKAAPETWAEASPITWIDGREPPMLLVHGEADDNIPPGQSEDFAAALEAAGVDVELLLIPKASHNSIKYHVDALAAIDGFLRGLE